MWYNKYMKTIKAIKFNKFRTSDFHNQGEYDYDKHQYIAEQSLFVYSHLWAGARSSDDQQVMQGYTYGRYAIVHVFDRRRTVEEQKQYVEDGGKWHVFQYSKNASLLDTQSGEAFHGTLMGRFKTLTAAKEWFLQREK